MSQCRGSIVVTLGKTKSPSNIGVIGLLSLEEFLMYCIFLTCDFLSLFWYSVISR